jgi:hypothetical protein
MHRCINLTLLCLILSTPLVARAAADDTNSIEMPSFGVASAPIPTGWHRGHEPDESIAIRWEFSDGKSKDPVGVIDLQAYPKRSAASVQALAQKEAKRFGGRLSNEAFEIGGVEAFEFVIAPKSEGNDGPTPLRARFIKNGTNYLALYERAATEATKDVFDKIATQLMMVPPAPPSESLGDRVNDPIIMPAVKLAIGLPDPFRISIDDSKRPEYHIINFATELTEAELVMSPVSMFNENFDTFLPTLGKSLSRQYGWSEPPTWHRVAGKIPVAFSDLMPAGKDERGRPVSPMQLMLISANNGAQLLTIKYPGSPESAARYAKKWESIAKSVRAPAAPNANRK